MINHKIPITTAAMLLAMILFLKFGFSFLSQIPFLMHPTVRYKARHINTIHSPERSCLLSFPMAIWVSITASNPQKASQHPLCSIFRSFSSCNSSRLLFVFLHPRHPPKINHPDSYPRYGRFFGIA